MRGRVGKGQWLAAPAAFLLLVAACAPPTHNTGNLVLVSPTPTPSPSPTPTTAFAASGPGFHAGEEGIAYGAVALTASGGVKPYRWSVATGALPPGLTLGADGTVSGSPTAAGHYTFTIQAADSGDSTVPIPGAIDVAAALQASLISTCAKYCNVELGCLNACGAFGQQSGGVGPFAYNLASGQLPAGTALSGLSLKGTFTGLPGYLQFTVQVTDALGASASVSPTFWMYAHIALNGGGCYGNYGTGCTVTLPIAGGVPGGRPSVALIATAPNTTSNPAPFTGTCWNTQSATPLPSYSLAVSGKSVVLTIPSGMIGGYGGIWTLQLTDHTPCAASTSCTSEPVRVVIGVQCG